MKKLRLKKDLIIPKGTEFECIDDSTREFIDGNYEATFVITKDSTGYFIVTEDCLDDDRFETIN